MKRILLWLWKSLPLSPAMQFAALWLLNRKFLLGVTAVVVDEAGRVLLLKHSYRDEFPWGLPSGWVRRQEQPQEAVAREVREETGLEVAVLSVLDVRIDRRFPRLDLAFLCRPAGSASSVPPGALGPRDAEITEAGFYRQGHLPGRLGEPQPELIERALTELGSGEPPTPPGLRPRPPR